ncbi:MAG: HEAT repeat domain-containing protein [Ktedonobacteraceae bacterium]|nr:HEAT repeat domain-containing protein [Ktedonobacteraceae bacterium]
MQNNENEWQSKQDRTAGNEEPEHPEPPSSLLFTILHNLELSPERTPSTPSLDDVLLQLHSPAWQDRTMALHTLEKLDYPVSIDLLSPLLQDEDATVRATTIHALSMISKHMPLHWLIEALHDTDWHVREVAVFALAKQGARVPREVLMAALHDKDGSVREAASFVLQQNDHTSSDLYGQLREETPMHNELYDPTRRNGKSNGLTSENIPPSEWSGAYMEYSGTRPHVVNEQAQAYAAGQYVPHNATSHEDSSAEYAEITPSRHEKVTSYRLHRPSHKGWWAAIIVVALVFFSFGCLSVMYGSQANFNTTSKSVQSAVAPASTENFPVGPDYAALMQKTLAVTLHLTQQQLLAKLKDGGNLNNIAAEQGVSTGALEKSEMSAFNTILQQATSRGDISPAYADQWMNQLQKNSGLREKIAITLLTFPSK